MAASPTIAVIGFSNTAYRTACRLATAQVPVLLLVNQSDAHLVSPVPMGITLLVLPYLRPAELPPEITSCCAAVVATEDEQFNLHVTMQLSQLSPTIRIVTRCFNLALGREIESRLPQVTVLSVSELAAPFFAAAAFVDEVSAAWHDEKNLSATVTKEDIKETLTLQHPLWQPSATPKTKRTGSHKSHMDRWLVTVLVGILLVIASGTLFFSLVHHFPLGDALYFVVTTLTTTGYGDYSLKDFPFSAKLAGMGVMLSGATLFAILFALITDKLFRLRLETILGHRPVKKTGHIIVCGAGDIGSRVLDCLRLTEAEVVMVERDPERRFNQGIRHMGVPLIIADATLEDTLERAGIDQAQVIICATDQDMVNLEIALNARALNPDIRLVLRIYDQDFAAHMRTHFGFQIALSSSGIASEAFAAAALHM